LDIAGHAKIYQGSGHPCGPACGCIWLIHFIHSYGCRKSCGPEATSPADPRGDAVMPLEPMFLDFDLEMTVEDLGWLGIKKTRAQYHSWNKCTSHMIQQCDIHLQASSVLSVLVVVTEVVVRL